MIYYVALGTVVGVAWLFGCVVHRRERKRLTVAYCEGFRDGVVYEAKMQAEHGRRALVRAGMGVN